VECNPETLSPEKAEILGHFANRISLGVQTFNRTHRHTLARRGTVDNIFKAVENLRDAGISNISADLIYGIPGQAIEELEYDLEKTLALGVNHISAYSLTFEEGSKLFEKMMPARYTDLSVEMWKFIADFLKSRGFERYEISNYARPGFECGHNLEIWRGGTYAGIGPAASSFDGISRSTEVPDIKKWLNATPPEKDFILPANRQLEIFVMGLRTVKGWTKESLNSLFVHEPPENIRKECRNFAEEGFIDLSGDGIRLTEKGLLFWDSIATELI
jgi:oxygen-independent coproporphyrinogen-3 oxidase